MGCVNSNSAIYADMQNRSIEYQLQGDQYVVVVAMDGLTESKAKEWAKKRAAEITVDQGGRYFTIDSMDTTLVAKPNQVPENQRFYGNMYQELIIEKDFDRDRLMAEQNPNTNIYSAIRLVFTTYSKKPNSKAIDACTLTQCPNR